MTKLYQDKKLSPEIRAKNLLSLMSVSEKMAQTQSVFPLSLLNGEDSVQLIEEQCKNGIGSVSTLEMQMFKSLHEVALYQKRMQAMIMKNSPHQIPAFFHMEGLRGGFIQDNTSFPSGINRGSSWDPMMEYEIAKVVARQERAVGVSQILAPILDISRDSRMGRQGETYGEDPSLSAALGAAFVKGIQESERGDGVKASAVAKHFLGFHNSIGGIHGVDSQTPMRLLNEVYGKPFQAAIAKSGLKGIMPCYDTINGEAVSSSNDLLMKLLRDEMGFQGICVSDYGAVENQHNVQGLYESLTETGYRSMKAGMDMEWPQKSCFNDELEAGFISHQYDIDVLDRAVERILTEKFRLGLFEHPFALESTELQKEFYDSNDKQLTLHSAEESIVLLKNNGVLPLKRNIKKIALVGIHANDARFFFGGYTHINMVESVFASRNSMAGIQSDNQPSNDPIQYLPGTNIQNSDTKIFHDILKSIKPECKNLFEQMKYQLKNTQVEYAYGYPFAGNDTTHFDEALKLIRESDLCILTLGGKNGCGSISSMGEGVDSSNINLPECQDQFILEASKTGKPLIGIHLDGRPISSNIADEKLDAILEAWLPAEEGAKAIVNVLQGIKNPSGKLPLSVAYNAGQIPIYYNHPNGSAFHQGLSIGFPTYVDLPHKPRYPFGFGLSYTEFEYRDLTIKNKNVSPKENVEITCTIKNIGKAVGKEVVQLYLKDVYAKMVRPYMELAGFVKIELNPGEAKTITFFVNPSQVAYLDLENRWYIEAGRIDIFIGRSSEHIELTDSFFVTDSIFIEGKEREFYAIGTISIQ